MKMMNIAAALMALAWLSTPVRADAQENPYDVLGKALVPIASIFAFDPTEQLSGSDAATTGHALVLDAHLIGAANLPPALQGQVAHFALQAPDKLLLQAPIAGQLLTVCRDGDSLWATPGSQIQALLAQATAAATPGKKKKSKAEKLLRPLALPIRKNELVFLPILFQVADGGFETIGSQQCRVLDVQFMPQLAKSTHTQDWTARLWVGPDYGIVQFALTSPQWSGKFAIDKLTLPPSLPDGTFQPQGTDVLNLTAAQFLDLMGRLGRE
jgi:hypothetical protein